MWARRARQPRPLRSGVFQHSWSACISWALQPLRQTPWSPSPQIPARNQRNAAFPRMTTDLNSPHPYWEGMCMTEGFREHRRPPHNGPPVSTSARSRLIRESYGIHGKVPAVPFCIRRASTTLQSINCVSICSGVWFQLRGLKEPLLLCGVVRHWQHSSQRSLVSGPLVPFPRSFLSI